VSVNGVIEGSLLLLLHPFLVIFSFNVSLKFSAF